MYWIIFIILNLQLIVCTPLESLSIQVLSKTVSWISPDRNGFMLDDHMWIGIQNPSVHLGEKIDVVGEVPHPTSRGYSLYLLKSERRSIYYIGSGKSDNIDWRLFPQVYGLEVTNITIEYEKDPRHWMGKPIEFWRIRGTIHLESGFSFIWYSPQSDLQGRLSHWKDFVYERFPIGHQLQLYTLNIGSGMPNTAIVRSPSTGEIFELGVAEGYPFKMFGKRLPKQMSVDGKFQGRNEFPASNIPKKLLKWFRTPY